MARICTELPMPTDIMNEGRIEVTAVNGAPARAIRPTALSKLNNTTINGINAPE